MNDVIRTAEKRVELTRLNDQRAILLAKQAALANELKVLDAQILRVKRRGTFL